MNQSAGILHVVYQARTQTVALLGGGGLVGFGVDCAILAVFGSIFLLLSSKAVVHIGSIGWRLLSAAIMASASGILFLWLSYVWANMEPVPDEIRRIVSKG